MKFYCGENRLRQMSDELCCCGVEGMGWRLHTSNLNHYLFDRENFNYTESQKNIIGSAAPFFAIHQDSASYLRIKDSTFKEELERHLKPLYFKALLPDPKPKSGI